MFGKKVPGNLRVFYRGMPRREAWICVAFFAALLAVLFAATGGFPRSKFLVIHPRDIFSAPAVFLANFFHLNFAHLAGNLLIFIPFGFWVFRQEGARGIASLLIGMSVSGAVVWLLAAPGQVSAGFSGAVFACFGILLIRSLRVSIPQTALLVVVIGVLLDTNFFETIRPTAYARENRISWLAHLGGLLGGMGAQIRSLHIALEMLHKQRKVTDEEFAVIAARIDATAAAPTPEKSSGENSGESSGESSGEKHG